MELPQHLSPPPYYRQVTLPRRQRGWGRRCVAWKPAGTGPQAGWAYVNKRELVGEEWVPLRGRHCPLLCQRLRTPSELFMFGAVAVLRLWDIVCQALFTDLNLHNRSEEERLTFSRLPQHSLHPDRSALCLHGNLPAMRLRGTPYPPCQGFFSSKGQVQSRHVRKWKSSTEPFKFHNQ